MYMCVINLLFILFLLILCAYVLSSIQSSLFEIKLAVSFSAMHFFQLGGLVLPASVLSARLHVSYLTLVKQFGILVASYSLPDEEL